MTVSIYLKTATTAKPAVSDVTKKAPNETDLSQRILSIMQKKFPEAILERHDNRDEIRANIVSQDPSKTYATNLFSNSKPIRRLISPSFKESYLMQSLVRSPSSEGTLIEHVTIKTPPLSDDQISKFRYAYSCISAFFAKNGFKNIRDIEFLLKASRENRNFNLAVEALSSHFTNHNNINNTKAQHLPENCLPYLVFFKIFQSMSQEEAQEATTILSSLKNPDMLIFCGTVIALNNLKIKNIPFSCFSFLRHKSFSFSEITHLFTLIENSYQTPFTKNLIYLLNHLDFDDITLEQLKSHPC